MFRDFWLQWHKTAKCIDCFYFIVETVPNFNCLDVANWFLKSESRFPFIFHLEIHILFLNIIKQYWYAYLFIDYARFYLIWIIIIIYKYLILIWECKLPAWEKYHWVLPFFTTQLVSLGSLFLGWKCKKIPDFSASHL